MYVLKLVTAAVSKPVGPKVDVCQKALSSITALIAFGNVIMSAMVLFKVNSVADEGEMLDGCRLAR